MKLNIVPARTGLLWVKLGIRTFFKQPVALTGLFFLFMAVASVASFIPVLGSVLALALLPAITLGFMVATQQAAEGKFPMPVLMLAAFRAERQRAKDMLVLGLLYAAGFLLIMGLTSVLDGGQFAKLYLLGGSINQELVLQPSFQSAMWLALALYTPFSLLFWHAPALVHWYGLGPAKALFFSAVACWRNLGAFTLYGGLWMGLFLSVGLLASLVGALMGSPGLLASILAPLALMLAAMFFSSIYFSFRDNFVTEAPANADPLSSTFR